MHYVPKHFGGAWVATAYGEKGRGRTKCVRSRFHQKPHTVLPPPSYVCIYQHAVLIATSEESSSFNLCNSLFVFARKWEHTSETGVWSSWSTCFRDSGDPWSSPDTCLHSEGRRRRRRRREEEEEEEEGGGRRRKKRKRRGSKCSSDIVRRGVLATLLKHTNHQNRLVMPDTVMRIDKSQWSLAGNESYTSIILHGYIPQVWWVSEVGRNPPPLPPCH